MKEPQRHQHDLRQERFNLVVVLKTMRIFDFFIKKIQLMACLGVFGTLRSDALAMTPPKRPPRHPPHLLPSTLQRCSRLSQHCPKTLRDRASLSFPEKLKTIVKLSFSILFTVILSFLGKWLLFRGFVFFSSVLFLLFWCIPIFLFAPLGYFSSSSGVFACAFFLLRCSSGVTCFSSLSTETFQNDLFFF